MDRIIDILAYHRESPLIFTKLFFWGFFAIVLLGYSIVYKKSRSRTIYLLLASFYFYYKTSGPFILLLIFTIVSDYNWGFLLARAKTEWKRKLFLTCSVVLNLALLCYFKYAYFFVDNINDLTGTHLTFFNHYAAFSNTWFSTDFSVEKLYLPIGISFFTFQSLSYTIDMYRRKIEPVRDVFDYGFFVCFFPHLVAGPIVKAHDFLYQIYAPYKLSKKEFGLALFWILNGLGKKIIADYLAVNFVDRIFGNPGLYSGVESILGIFGYSMQIYLDFSGYTDIAIGVALLLGFRLKKNFNSPYKAESTSEFWKRWHISLSSWLKEYLYIPLGGNRNGTIGSYVAIGILCFVMILLFGSFTVLYIFAGIAAVIFLASRIFPAFRHSVNTNINILVTMLLGGLWHGSSWMFIIWGGLNGLGLMIHKGWERFSPLSKNTGRVYRAWCILLTLIFISFTRIWFRSSDLETVGIIFDRIGHHFGGTLIFSILAGYKNVLIVLLLAYLIHWIPETTKERYREWFSTRSEPALAGLTVCVIFLLYQAMAAGTQPFIYFQF